MSATDLCTVFYVGLVLLLDVVKENISENGINQIITQVKPVLRTCIYHCNSPVLKDHLSYEATFFLSLRQSLKTGLTVFVFRVCSTVAEIRQMDPADALLALSDLYPALHSSRCLLQPYIQFWKKTSVYIIC